jgi:ABC-type amino acid transport substrate-binding protein
VPYMLDSLRVPGDMFQLFLVTGIVVGRLGAMLAALHIIVLSVIGTIALAGGIRIQVRTIARYLVITSVAMFVLVVGLRGYFMVFVPQSPDRQEVLAEIHLMVERPAASVSVQVPETSGAPLEGSRLDHINSSGMLQVGYRPNNLPCSYLTPAGELVGFDVEMAYSLAEDLGVGLSFVPFVFDRLGGMLSAGDIDLAMSCIASLPDRYAFASFSRSYLDLTLAFIVPDYQRDLFADIDSLRARDDLEIALVSSNYFRPRIARMLPNAKIIVLEAAEDFFSDSAHGADALLLSAEEGTAYAYRYPHYTVVKAKRGGILTPAAYAVPKGDAEMIEFVSNWVDLKRKEGSVDTLYDYWMVGGAVESKKPRWSIIRDVLHWID